MSKRKMTKKEWDETLGIINKMPRAEIEEKKQCWHLTLTKVVKDSFTYRCDECPAVIVVFGSAVYHPAQYIKETMAINGVLITQDKDAKEMMERMIETVEEEPKKWT